MLIDYFGGLNTICISLISDKINFQARERNLSKGKGGKKSMRIHITYFIFLPF